MTTTDPTPDQVRAHSDRPRWIALIALAVVVGVGAVIAAVVVTGDDDTATAAPLSQVQSSCGDWMDSSSGGTRPDAQWCTDMFAWMNDRSGGSMMDTMMWQGSDQMGRACREWAADERAETDVTGAQQCDAMVEWMDGHMSSRDGRWMMQGR